MALLVAGAMAVVGCSSEGSGSQSEVTVTVISTVPFAGGGSEDSASSPSHSVGETVSESSHVGEPSETAGTPAAAEPASTVRTSVGSASSSSSTTSATNSSDPAAMPVVDTSKDTVVWGDNSMVPHLFFHSLVINPTRAFSDAESGSGYLDYMATRSEFAKILPQLYGNGYVLVGPHQLATVEAGGQVKPKALKLPEGKKPLVISIDDVSYYEYMEGDGFATDLFVAKNRRVLNHYTDAQGKTHERSYDVMSMVDDFVREHPDFSHDGARGVIALTGYNGVLGYRSSPSEYAGKNPNLDKDIATATEVAKALKEEGWEFASHSWGHINFTKSSLGRIKADTTKWKSDVEPIVGPTDMLIYPFGADISGVPHYQGEKFDYLKGQGYSFYFNVDGSVPAWGQWGDEYLREARINVDGISMRAAMDGRKVLAEFFDVKSVLDPARPASISGAGS